MVPPHPAALFVTNKLGADVGTVVYGLLVGLTASLVGGPLFLKLLGNRLPFKTCSGGVFRPESARRVHPAVTGRNAVHGTAADRPDAGETVAELNMADKTGTLYTLLELSATRSPRCLSLCLSPITCWNSPAYGHMTMLTHTEHGFGSIANILLIIGAGGAFNAILKPAAWRMCWHIFSLNLHMHPILLAWLVALVLHAAVGSATVAMMGATAIVAPMLPLYPNVSSRSSTLPSVPVPLVARS